MSIKEFDIRALNRFRFELRPKPRKGSCKGSLTTKQRKAIKLRRLKNKVRRKQNQLQRRKK